MLIREVIDDESMMIVVIDADGGGGGRIACQQRASTTIQGWQHVVGRGRPPSTHSSRELLLT